jgi:glycosyltransferase involved in cell wall biosynthesis
VTPILSVLVPAYNEQETIGSVLSRVLALPVVREVIVVDDGSTDGTANIVERWCSKDERVKLLRQSHNQGKTAAILRALSAAAGDIIIIQDADLEYDPAEIPDVIEPILQGHADVVYGSRFLVKRATRVLYFYHFLANNCLTFLSNLFTNMNMSDIETGYKAFRASVIKDIPLSSTGFGMEVEITAALARLAVRVYEVPISYYGRTYAQGKKIGMRDGIHALYYILYYNAVGTRVGAYRRYAQRVANRLGRPSR